MKKLLFCLVSIIIITGLLFSGCTESEETTTTSPETTTTSPETTTTTTAPTTSPTSTPGPQYGGTLRIIPMVCPGGPIGWPAEGVGEITNTQQWALEPLLRNYWDGHTEGILAESWEVAEDGSYVTFYLREGVKFHDGSDFNADAVKFNYQALIDASNFATRYWESVEVIDEYTVRVYFTEWRNTNISFESVIVSPTAYETHGIEWMRENMVGTGPFKLVNFERDVIAEFVRNDDYWQEGKPYLDGVQMVYISEAWTQQAAIQGEDADMLLLDLGQAAYDLTQMGFECIYRPSGIVVLIPDSANPDSPFADKRVREAIEYAIDKEGLVAAKGYGFIDPAYQQALAGTLAYDPDFQGGRTYDVAKAKQLLADAGYPDGFTYNIIVTPTGMDRDMMVAVQSYLSKVGIEVTLDFVEYAKYLEYRYGEFPGNILAQPTGMWPNYNQHVGAYWAQTSNLFLSLERTEGLQALYDESSTLTEVDADMLREIASMIYEDAMVIPLYGAVSGAIVQDYVHDTGYLEGGVHFQAQPENAWISK